MKGKSEWLFMTTHPYPHLCRVKPEVESDVSWLHGIKQLPVYAQPTKMLSTHEAVGVLLNSQLEESSVCSRVPFAVEMNAVFIMSVNKLAAPKDLLCDDMGAWTWGGSSKRCISVDEEKFVIFLKKDQHDSSSYRVWKRYFYLKASPEVKRMVLMQEGRSWSVGPFCLEENVLMLRSRFWLVFHQCVVCIL